MAELIIRLGLCNSPIFLAIAETKLDKTTKDIIFEQELLELAKAKNVTIVINITRENTANKESFISGRLTQDTIAKNLASDYHTHTYMTCGPQAMMDDILSHLRSKQVKPEFIKQESFQN